MLAMDLSLSWNLDVMVRVCERLEVDDVLQCARVCSKWREFVETERMWRTLWDRDMHTFAIAEESFPLRTFASFREAYASYYGFHARMPVLALQKLLATAYKPDKRHVEGDKSDVDVEDCGYNHKTHEVGLAFRGETARLRSLLERTELGIDVNKLQCYKHWYYYGNFSHGMDGLIYKRNPDVEGERTGPGITLIDDVSDLSKSELSSLKRMVDSVGSWAVNPLAHRCFSGDEIEAMFSGIPKDYHYEHHVYSVMKVTRSSHEIQEKLWTKYRNYCGTLLHWAVLGNHLDTVKLLCEFGADVTIVVPKLNAKAIDIAKGNGCVEIYHYLKSCEQKPVAEKLVVK